MLPTNESPSPVCVCVIECVLVSVCIRELVRRERESVCVCDSVIMCACQ